MTRSHACAIAAPQQIEYSRAPHKNYAERADKLWRLAIANPDKPT